MKINNNHRIISLYSSLFFVVSLITVYMPVWLHESFHMEIKTIGILLAIIGICKIFYNVFIVKNLKDLPRQKNTLTKLAIAMIFTFLIILFLKPTEVKYLIILVFIGLILFAPIIPIVENVCSNLNNNFTNTYGKLRISGSLAFLLGVFFMGRIIDHYDTRIFPILLIIFLLIFLLVIFLIPTRKIKRNYFFEGTIIKVLQNKNFFIILISCSLIQGSHAMYYAFSAILWRKYEISFSLIGLLWAWGIVAEIIFFYIIDKLRINRNFVLIVFIASFLSSIRWLLSFFFTDFPKLLLVQTLHAVSFGLTHYIMMYFINTNMPVDEKLIAQSLYHSISSGIIMTLLTLICSWSFIYYSNGEGYLVMVFSCLLSGAIIFFGNFNEKNENSKKK